MNSQRSSSSESDNNDLNTTVIYTHKNSMVYQSPSTTIIAQITTEPREAHKPTSKKEINSEMMKLLEESKIKKAVPISRKSTKEKRRMQMEKLNEKSSDSSSDIDFSDSPKRKTKVPDKKPDISSDRSSDSSSDMHLFDLHEKKSVKPYRAPKVEEKKIAVTPRRVQQVEEEKRQTVRTADSGRGRESSRAGLEERDQINKNHSKRSRSRSASKKRREEKLNSRPEMSEAMKKVMPKHFD